MFKTSLYISIIILGLIFFKKIKNFYFFTNKNNLSYSKLISLVKENNIKEILISEKEIITLDKLGKHHETNGFFLNKKLITELMKNHIKFDIKIYKNEPNKLLNVFFHWVPIFLIFIFLFYTFKYIKKYFFNKKKNINKYYKKKKKNINFSNIAGYNDIKKELKEIIFFLKYPYKFKNTGANISKGILMIGEPGTGKTLIARAIAGEANVPFFNISGSSFIEIFVGVGAARVRKIFNNAKKKMPCIIFIDEIDTIGKKRHLNINNDEKDQTLNQLLIEMDGFKINSKIIVIAATNRPEVLDKALLRSGRFDKKIIIDLPNIKERQQILSIYIKKILTFKNIRTDILAKSTIGFSGADLFNLINESVLLAIKKNQNFVKMKNFEDAKEKIILGPKIHLILNKNDRKNIAYHESGHILVTKFLLKNNSINKVTILPRKYSLGLTWNFQENNIDNIYKNKILINISILLAGRISEKIFSKNISNGSSNDFKKATKLAKKIIMNYGMSKILANRIYENKKNKIYSEFIKKKIDKEINFIINKQYKISENILYNNKEILKILSKFLLKWETINSYQINEIFKGKKPNYLNFNKFKLLNIKIH